MNCGSLKTAGTAPPLDARIPDDLRLCKDELPPDILDYLALNRFRHERKCSDYGDGVG